MSELNPYEKFLDGRALDTILAATPGEIGRLLLAIGAEKENTAPAPGKWSPAEIIAHLAPLTGDAYNGHRETATAAVMSAALAIQRDRYPDRYREMLHGLVLRDSLMEPDRIAIGKTAVEALVAGCVIATVATVLTIWLL